MMILYSHVLHSHSIFGINWEKFFIKYDLFKLMVSILGKKIKILFEKGGEFLATLLEDKAPYASNQVWRSLPIETRAGQAARSGEVLNCGMPFAHQLVENSKLVLPHGGLALDGHNYRIHARAALVIAYGFDNMSYGYSGITNPISYFAQIEDGLDELYEIGLRNREYGREGVTFTSE